MNMEHTGRLLRELQVVMQNWKTLVESPLSRDLGRMPNLCSSVFLTPTLRYLGVMQIQRDQACKSVI